MEGIDFQDSFVLDWSLDSDQLVFKIEASIWPKSKHYTKPQNSEYTCYKKASLQFLNFKSIIGLKDKENIQQSTDASGSVDYGNIDSFTVTETGFSIAGDFGTVNITGGEVVFAIHT